MPHFIVIPTDDSLPEATLRRIKEETLGYVDTIVIEPGPRHPHIPEIHATARNHLRVFTQEDADIYVNALTQAFPGHTFTIQQQEGDLRLPDGSVPQS